MNGELLWKRFESQLKALQQARVNFPYEPHGSYTSASGWVVDEYDCELPTEPPGPPQEHGSWRIAKAVAQEYKFPDPNLIRGIYIPDVPLSERALLLEGRFMGMTFYFGAKVIGVIDETREIAGEPAQVWGFGYVTLEGHFEQGRILFEVRKFLQNGRVVFHIERFSKPDVIPNPFYRWGFKLFGRYLQNKFIHTSFARMRQFVEEELRTGRPIEETQPVGTPEVKRV